MGIQYLKNGSSDGEEADCAGERTGAQNGA